MDDFTAAEAVAPFVVEIANHAAANRLASSDGAVVTNERPRTQGMHILSKLIAVAGAFGAWVAGQWLDQAGEFLNVALLVRVVVVALVWWWLAKAPLNVRAKAFVPAIATQSFDLVQAAFVVSATDPRLLLFVGLALGLISLAIRPTVAVASALFAFQCAAGAWNVYQLFWPSILESESVLGHVALAAVISQILLRIVSMLFLAMGVFALRQPALVSVKNPKLGERVAPPGVDRSATI